MTDRRLDWKPRHDPRSLQYPVRTLIGSAVEDRPQLWKPGTVLDQGQEGACVGFGWTADLLASPRPDFSATDYLGNRYAQDVYRSAKQIDEWDGEDYSGTSVLAGAKVIMSRGAFQQYRWAFSVEDVRDAVISEGPVVIGIPWYDAMYEPPASGLVEVGGELVGGHCMLIHGYHPSMRITGEDSKARFKVFRVRNSWGPTWGNKGSGFIRYEDMRDLLSGQGEACVPMGRQFFKISPK